jgi:hypothetical protein
VNATGQLAPHSTLPLRQVTLARAPFVQLVTVWTALSGPAGLGCLGASTSAAAYTLTAAVAPVRGERGRARVLDSAATAARSGAGGWTETMQS